MFDSILLLSFERLLHTMTAQEYRDALRAFIKDHEYLNRLLDFKEESSDDELDLYINMSISEFNMIPPHVVTFSVADFPNPTLLIQQATIEALISNGIVASRNDLTFNNGGITTKIYDGTRYMNQLQVLMSVVERQRNGLQQYKVAININGGYGGVASPYSGLHSMGRTLKPSIYF